MQGYRTNTEYTGSLGYNSVCYITSRIRWVSLKGIYRYRCRRNPGKLYNSTFCYTYLTRVTFSLLHGIKWSMVTCQGSTRLELPQGLLVLGCGSLVRGRKRKKVDSRPFILPRRRSIRAEPVEAPLLDQYRRSSIPIIYIPNPFST